MLPCICLAPSGEICGGNLAESNGSLSPGGLPSRLQADSLYAGIISGNEYGRNLPLIHSYIAFNCVV